MEWDYPNNCVNLLSGVKWRHCTGGITMSSRKNRSPEEQARRTKIRELLELSDITRGHSEPLQGNRRGIHGERTGRRAGGWTGLQQVWLPVGHWGEDPVHVCQRHEDRRYWGTHSWHFGFEVSGSTVSWITDKILPMAKGWQQRSLKSIYVIVFLDAIHYHVRSEGQVVKKAVFSQ